MVVAGVAVFFIVRHIYGKAAKDEVVGMTSLNSKISADFRDFAIFGILVAGSLISAKIFKKKFSPILMILISSGLGMLFYSI